jgi:hypothetical protein
MYDIVHALYAYFKGTDTQVKRLDILLAEDLSLCLFKK